MEKIPIIKLYGAKGCHKTHYYQLLLSEIGLSYLFLDVETNKEYAEELRNLYENRKLNFPTITIGNKKLRNPTSEELQKWINKLIPQILKIHHDKDNNRYTLDINGEIAKIEYVITNDKMHLVHSEVPYNLRGKGIGKILVEKTFEELTEEGYKAIAICSYIKAIAKRSKKWSKIIG
ncbi:N-acetyltransferase [Aquimarina sp. 2201CG5-10]|uniref:N-acetyltransferase n=1 Tax=Aquimarina callyspongiae TaxID=3098150 RepID=UPI002AB49EB9|nr:N-acetyltransferase [Aquimarina sp. 2201CG5-10]MDY8135759.1 N-acetyltransferase [Aquimarina sp. 2201CG5-10]